MCRFSGFIARDYLPRLRPALLSGENSLAQLSARNPDGFGFRWVGLDGDVFHESRGVVPAAQSDAYRQEVLAADGQASAGVAHLREMTQGQPSLENTHPFIRGRWTFAHNGNLANFVERRAQILSQIDPVFHSAIKGETDSEHAFYLYLTRLNELSANPEHANANEAARALESTVTTLGRITNSTDRAPSAMNFVVMTPEVLAVSRYNRQLVGSDRMGRAPSDLRLEPGAAMVKGLAVASEPYAKSLGWSEVPERSVLAIDRDSALIHRTMDEANLPLGMCDLALARCGWNADA